MANDLRATAKTILKKVGEGDPKYTASIGILTIIAFAINAMRKTTAPGLAKSERLIKTLEPIVQKRARRFIINAHKAGIDIVVTSGRRSMESQEKLYAQGRTAPGEIVTKAKPGHSWHNHGLAIDVAILKDGQPTWPKATDPVWKKLGQIGAKQGFEHGARFGDSPHFDYHPNLTIAQAIAGKKVIV